MRRNAMLWAGLLVSTSVFAATDVTLLGVPEDVPGPTPRANYGRGEGRPAIWLTHQDVTVPNGDVSANVTGVFGSPIPWPLEPIHMALLPDGRVMSFGSQTDGRRGAEFSYDIWSPSLGYGSDAHLVLPNTTSTNIFCAGMALLPESGTLLMVGGSLRPQSYGINNVTAFSPSTDSLASALPMNYARWYATMVPLPNGQVYTAGGTGGPISAPSLRPSFSILCSAGPP